MRYDETPAVGLERPAKPVTLPKLKLPELGADETKENGEHLATMRVVQAGVEAWNNLGRNFDAYVVLGRALCVGKAWSMKAAKTNTAWGARYSKRFNEWLSAHGFNNLDMLKSTRSHCIELVENLPAIVQWRSTLTDKQRRRLQSPQQNCRRWRRETQQAVEPQRDDIAKALSAWRHFRTCMQALSPSHAGPVWEAVAAEAAAHA